MTDSKPLSGHHALVTGSSRRVGIGFAVARRLLGLGASVTAQGWTAHDAAQPWGADRGGSEAVVAELQAVSERIAYIESDLGDARAPAELLKQAQQRFGPVDILVANHARSGQGGLMETSGDELDAFFADNVRSTILLAQAFVAQRDPARGGRIVMLTSGQHLGPMPGTLAYVISKGAIHQATATLASELAPLRITVNAVNPGPTDTGWAIGDPGDQSPAGRWGHPDDAAKLIAWLCGDDAGWVTGQVINSEGGFRR